MAQAARGSLDARHFAEFGVSTEDSVAFTELPQLGFREKTLLCQQHVERQAAVSLAQDKTVPLRPARIGRVISQNLVVKDTEHFHQ